MSSLLTISALWPDSENDKLMIFNFFPRKKDLTLLANFHPRRQLAWNIKFVCARARARACVCVCVCVFVDFFQNVIYWNFYPACQALSMLTGNLWQLPSLTHANGYFYAFYQRVEILPPEVKNTIKTIIPKECRVSRNNITRLSEVLQRWK